MQKANNDQIKESTAMWASEVVDLLEGDRSYSERFTIDGFEYTVYLRAYEEGEKYVSLRVQRKPAR